MSVVAGGTELKYDKLSLIAFGGQSEIGQVLWAVSYAGEIMLIDAGACYPGTDLPGVDLLLPNTNFLQINQNRISALLLTNGHEEHCGAVAYLLNHIKIPRIMAPRFVSALVSQNLMSKTDTTYDAVIDTVETRHPYQIGAFEVEWIQVNDAIADACALRISSPEGNIVYTSSFKLDQTPVDSRLMDVARLAQIGDAGVTLLISNSAGVESRGYTPSEKAVAAGLEKHMEAADGRLIVIMNGTNTHRLQILFDLAKRLGRKVVLYGDTLIQTAVAAVITGNLVYDRAIEAPVEQIDEENVLVVATGADGDALGLLHEIAHHKNHDLVLRKNDLIIYSADILPGRSRRMAMILDQLLSLGVRAVISTRDGVHVTNHGSQEELKLMLSITKPRFFVPALGEGRQIMRHAELATDFGILNENVFPLRNGEILEIGNGQAAVVGSVEAEAVLYNRDQAESVTRFSVNERRALSMEGVLTVGCVIDSEGNLVQTPVLEGAALSFTNSQEWISAREELIENLREAIDRHKESEAAQDFTALRATLREVTSKTIRSRFQSKPTIQVIIHEVAPKYAV